MISASTITVELLYWINNTSSFHDCFNFFNEVESHTIIWNREDWRWFAGCLNKWKKSAKKTTLHMNKWMGNESTILHLVVSGPVVTVHMVWCCPSIWQRVFLQMHSGDKGFILQRHTHSNTFSKYASHAILETAIFWEMSIKFYSKLV